MTTQTQARPLFAAKLTPNRSLGKKGLRIIVAVFAVLLTLPTIVFFSLGAWPIIGFMGFDVLLIWWALSSSMRDSQRYETVTLWPDQLELKQVNGRGNEVLTRFQPSAVKLVVDRDINEKTTGLHLRTADRDIVLGGFLNNDEKSSFAKAFGTALKRARR